jgi:sigma-B regulation protein RsbU (phosphoserine phosphatase)
MEATTEGHGIKVLLVDDQRIIGEAVRRMLASEPDIEYHYVQDPHEAVAAAGTLQPTLILQDLVMPGVDGIDLVRQFRASLATQRIPLVVLSSREEASTKAEAFAAGANDYLVKLPDPLELIARIRHHSLGYLAQIERDEAFRALEESQQALAQELTEAADYVRSLLPEPRRCDQVATAWVFQPCSSLGGDSFGYFDIDSDHFALFLLDVCNHGIGSALLSVSAMNALVRQTLVDVDFRDPVRVLEALNQVFQMEKHNNLYFTLWYGVIQWSSRRLTYSSAGHPPAVLMVGSDTQTLRARAMPIGTDPDAQFESAETVVPVGAKLYVFSDGIYEIQTRDGEEVDLPSFLEILRAPEGRPGAKVDEVLETMAKIQGRDQFDDDVSLMELKFV